MEMNAANWLTLFRIILIPVLVMLFYLPPGWSNWATAIVFSLAAVTDWLDGFVARRFNLTSEFGEFLDPVADKLMVAVALVILVQSHPTPYFAVPAAIIIGREITISALREWMSRIGRRAVVGVVMIGKIKTTFQMFAIAMLLLNQDLSFFGLGVVDTFYVGHACLWIAAVLTMWSMVQYVKSAMQEINNHRSES